jgi:hypothetical protein
MIELTVFGELRLRQRSSGTVERRWIVITVVISLGSEDELSSRSVLRPLTFGPMFGNDEHVESGGIHDVMQFMNVVILVNEGDCAGVVCAEASIDA